VATALVVGSGDWPAWTACVSNFMVSPGSGVKNGAIAIHSRLAQQYGPGTACKN